MRVFITGGRGQLGQALKQALESHIIEAPGRTTVDITDADAVFNQTKQFQPDVVIHAAAMTNVNQCARQPKLAYHVNAIGTQNVALACQKAKAPLLYISTNEVFDGTATEPYPEWNPKHPINPYASSKAAGEEIVQHLLSHFYIVRTAWLFAPTGRNFLHRVIQLADEQRHLKVVTDEISNPTYVLDLAKAIEKLIQTERYGIYHLTNQGYCSRYDFAKEIMRFSRREAVTIESITSSEYQRSSTPPLFAPLENIAAASMGISLRPWQDALSDYFQQHQ